ncbi:MAG: hypothetical protein IT168_19480, partial [Bryobacterales bacterium]|nr:hypothetical protein [Bryobacterales bacterium]
KQLQFGSPFHLRQDGKPPSPRAVQVGPIQTIKWGQLRASNSGHRFGTAGSDPILSIYVYSEAGGDPRPYVNARKNLFYCHGCGRGGDLIRFVELWQHLSFSQSLAFLQRQLAAPQLSEVVEGLFDLAVLWQAGFAIQPALSAHTSHPLSATNVVISIDQMS